MSLQNVIRKIGILVEEGYRLIVSSYPNAKKVVACMHSNSGWGSDVQTLFLNDKVYVILDHTER